MKECVCERESVRKFIDKFQYFFLHKSIKGANKLYVRKYVRAKFDKNWKRKCVPIFLTFSPHD